MSVVLSLASLPVGSIGCNKESAKQDAEQPAPRSDQPAGRASGRDVAPVPDARVQETVIGILAKQAGNRGKEVKTGLDLKKDLKFDELDEVETVMAMEDAFSMSVPDDAAKKIRTVDDWVEYARAHRKR